MKTVMEKNIKVQEYKGGGGKVATTVKNGEGDTVRQEIRTTNQEKFENLVANQLSSIPNQPEIPMKTDN